MRPLLNPYAPGRPRPSGALASTGEVQAPAWRPAVRTALADHYLLALGLVLLGYGVMGRGFAYVGMPPVFLGEVLLGTGLLLWLNSRAVGRVLAMPAMQALVLLLAWVAFRTIPNLGTYGIDAARDAMLAGYGAFAFIVAGLLVARPERLRDLARRYRTFVVVMVAVAWGLYLVFRQMPEVFPKWPWALNTRVIENKPGDLLVHFAGITAFLVLGFRRATPLVLVLLVAGVGVSMVGNRGGMLGYLLAMGVLALLKPREARFGRLAYAGVLLVALALLADTTHLRTNEGSRAIAVEQLWENVKSVFGRSDAETLNTTTEWRLEWWTKIAGYTFDGPYFWTGKGYGINLATDDGFRVDEHESLRSPHNAHLTMLARGGVPGLALWLVVHACWLGTLFGGWARARRAGQARWMGVYALCAVYWVAAMVNGSFDVYLEGPMGGIWFWTVFGVGMAAVWIHRRHPDFWGAEDRAALVAAPRPVLPVYGPRRVAPSIV